MYLLSRYSPAYPRSILPSTTFIPKPAITNLFYALFEYQSVPMIILSGLYEDHCACMLACKTYDTTEIRRGKESVAEMQDQIKGQEHAGTSSCHPNDKNF